MNLKNIPCRFVLSLFLFFLLSVGWFSIPAFASNLDDISIEIENVTGGLSLPVSIKNAGDGSGNIFIVEQGGRILIFDGAQLPPGLFLDISTLVSNGGEQGLLDVAFHPDYANNGFFFIHYTDKQGDTVVARYSRSAADPLVADPASAVPTLAISQPFTNHNGGQMQFGPDGFLYIALGDGGSPVPAQDLNQLLGKILRIDVDNGLPYTIPADNPFVGIPNTRPEIWAYGLRNPWRMSFDRATGDLLIADVGQSRFEEVNFQPAASTGGENYGWPLMEGNSCFQPANNCNDGSLTLPVLEYTHAEGNCSITGGYRYRGSAFPQLNGVYFHGDVCSGRIWGGGTDFNGNWDSRTLLDTTNFITTFGEDENGEVYLAAHGAGVLLRINQINIIPRDTYDVVANLSGTMFCDDGLGGADKKKLKDKAEVTLDLSAFPVVTAEVELENLGQSFDLTGLALLKNPKSGVLQLFGDDGGDKELALSGNIKLNKKTGIWKSLKGKFQFQDNGDPVCTLAGKFKAK